MAERLHLPEEVLLLALRDREGTIALGTQFRYAIGGAALAEMLLEGRAVAEPEGSKQFLRLVDNTPFGDPVLDELLARIGIARRRAQFQHWVTRFANMAGLRDRVAAELCRKKVLQSTEDKVLLLFKRKRYPELNPVPEREIIKRLERAIFSDSKSVAPRTVVLLSLANAANVLQANFDKKELKKRKARIEQVVSGELTGRATLDAIRTMQAAVAAVTVATAAAVASS